MAGAVRRGRPAVNADVYASVHVEASTGFELTRWTTLGDGPTVDPRGRYVLNIGERVNVFLEPSDLIRLSETLAGFVAEQRDVWEDEAAAVALDAAQERAAAESVTA